MRYEKDMLVRGIEQGTLVASMGSLHQVTPENVSKLHRVLAPAILAFTERAGFMTVHGLEPDSVSTWGGAVKSSLIPVGKEMWRVSAGADVFRNEPDFVCRVPRLGVHNGVFAWVLDRSEAEWIGSELKNLAVSLTVTDPYKAMIPSMKRMFRNEVEMGTASVCLEFGRFSNAFRILTKPPLPQSLIAGLLGKGTAAI